jgi:hypothetical protein
LSFDLINKENNKKILKNCYWKIDERTDDVKSLWPLWLGLHT